MAEGLDVLLAGTTVSLLQTATMDYDHRRQEAHEVELDTGSTVWVLEEEVHVNQPVESR